MQCVHLNPGAEVRSRHALGGCPECEFVAIPDAGHFALFMKPDEFLRELVTRVRPLAMKR